MSETAEATEETGVKEGIANPEASEAQEVESDKDYNFRQLREKTERLEAENRKQQQYVEQMRHEMAQMAKQAEAKQAGPSPWEGLDPFAEDFGQRLREGIRQTLTEGMTEMEKARQSDPEYRLAKIRQKHADFDQVVNDETVEKLKYERPFLWESISKSSDPLQAAYEALKDSARPVSSQADRYAQEERRKLEENRSKPKDPASLPQSTRLGSSTGFRRPDAETRARIWKEHRQRMRERGH